jgi:Sec-independent protein translocase protein TatA
MATIEQKAENDRAKLESIQQTDTKQTRDIAELMDLNEKQQRLIDGLTDRLNGKGLVQVDPYEKVVAQVRQLAEMMQGGEGQLSFAQLRNSIQNTQFLGKVMYGAIGLFGVGGVMAAGLALFGVEKVPPEVQSLQQSMTDVRKDVDTLQTQWNEDVQRRLSEKSAPQKN